MLKEKFREKVKQTCIPLTLTYNRFCPTISKVIRNKLTRNKYLTNI